MKRASITPSARKALPSLLAALLSFNTHAAAPAGTNPSSSQPGIPYVVTRLDAVRDLLWIAEVGTNDVVYDLGSGDGRIVIAAVRDFHARKAVGIEINPDLVRQSRQEAANAKLSNRVQFIQGDLFTNDFSEASVVVVYLGQQANIDLRERIFRTLKPGTRIVSHEFDMGEWIPDRTLVVRRPYLGMFGEAFNEFRGNPDVPEYRSLPGPPTHESMAAWIVPAPVAGVWRGKVPLAAGAGELTLNLHQRLSVLSGYFQFRGTTNWEGVVQAELWGDHVRLHCIPTNNYAYGVFLATFDGQARGNTLNGKLEVSQNPRPDDLASERKIETFTWSARRDQADFTGTWEWTGVTDSPVRLKIERRNGRWAATYADPKREVPASAGGNQPIPVPDFYDFGGGFYFTVKVGETRVPGGVSRISGPGNGWFVGEAILQNNTLAGNIAYYSFRTYRGLPDPKSTAREGRTDWRPKRVTP